MSNVPYWQCPPQWDGPVAVLGAGPSLERSQIEQLIDAKIPMIAVNQAYRLAPEADFHYFCDRRYFNWYSDDPEWHAFHGERVTLENEWLQAIDPSIYRVKNDGRHGMTFEPGKVRNGANAGYQAIQLAAQLGGNPILLLGFNMCFHEDGRSHFHGNHPRPNIPEQYSVVMLPRFDQAAKDCEAAGVKVINTTPRSALTQFPFMNLFDAIQSLLTDS